LAQATTEPDGLPTPQRYWAAATIWLALTLSVLDGSIANVALPTIAADLNAPAADSVWVVNNYQLAIVISLLPMAAIGEMVSFRRVFQLGIIVFSLGSLGCTFAHSLPMLAFARAIQGFGAAGIMSQNGALVRFTYPSKMLGRGLGLNALVASAGAALGPTVAAGILAVAPWQWLFAVNVPIGIAAYLLGRKSLPDNPKSGSFDIEGTLLSASMFGLGFIGIDLLTRGGNIWIGMSALALGAGSGLGLVLHSRSQSEPIVPFDLLRNPVFSLSVATSIASFASQMLAFVSLPFFFESALHRSQVETGLLVTPWPLAVGIGAPIAGRLADRVSAAVLGAAGLVVLCAGLALLAVPRTRLRQRLHGAWPCAVWDSAFFKHRTTARCCRLRRSRVAGRQAACSPPLDSRGRPSAQFSPRSRSGLPAIPRPQRLAWRQRWQPSQR
jgi:DHA2 family multidrug resistance protein-like MFS transporter